MTEYKLLADLFEEPPEENELIWNFIDRQEFATGEFAVVTIDPVAWYTKPDPNGQTLKEIYKSYATQEQKKYVQQLRKRVKKLPCVIICHDVLVDGYHRMIAYALEGVTEAEALRLDMAKAPIWQ